MMKWDSRKLIIEKNIQSALVVDFAEPLRRGKLTVGTPDQVLTIAYRRRVSFPLLLTHSCFQLRFVATPITRCCGGVAKSKPKHVPSVPLRCKNQNASLSLWRTMIACQRRSEPSLNCSLIPGIYYGRAFSVHRASPLPRTVYLPW